MKTGNIFKIGAVLTCLFTLALAGSAAAQTISVDLDRNAAGIQSTLNASAGATVQGSIVVDGIAAYRGHTVRVQVVDPTKVNGAITYSDADIAGVGASARTITSGGVTFMSSVKLFTTEPDWTTFPVKIFNFDIVLAADFSGSLPLHIIYVGDTTVPSNLQGNLAIVVSGGSLAINTSNFTLADGTVSAGAVETPVTPTPTPTMEETATPTPTVEEPTATPTETSPIPVGAQIVMDGFGGFHPAGNAPDLLNKESFYPGFDIVRDFEILPDNSGVVAVDGYGASIVLPFPGASPKLKGSLQEIDRTILPPFTPGLDQYTALVTTADSAGYWVMNDSGQIFGVGSGLPAGATEALLFDLALDLTPDATSGVNRGVDFAVVENASGVQAIVVLTAYGAQLVPAGDVSVIGLQMAEGQVTGDGTYGAPFFGWDIARDIDLEPNGQGYMILDGFGGIHPVGGARAQYDAAFLNGPRPGMPAEAGGHVYFGWDVAEKIDYTSDGLGLIMLDAFGGVHFDGSIAPAYGAYFNFDIARDVELYEVIAN